MSDRLPLAELAARARRGDEDARAELRALPAPTTFAVHGELRDDADAGMELDGEFINPANLSDERFQALVDKIRAGHMRRLRFRARVFIERPNFNLTRPKPGELPRIAAEGAGALYLYDHSGRSVAARVGVAVSAETVPFEDTTALVVVIDITDPGAQEKFLRGESDRFSIGLTAEGAECSVCGGEVNSSWWWWDLECGHELGKEYPSQETGARVLTEVFLLGASMREVSTVNFPAVDDTAVLSQCGRPAALTTSGATPAETKEADMANEAKSDDLAVRLAEATAAQEQQATELAQLRAAKEETDKQLFQALFAQGLNAHKFTPAEEEDERALFAARGAEAYKASVARRKPIAGYHREEIGVSSDSPGDAAAVKVDDLALARHANLPASHKTPEKLEEIGFNRLRIDG